MNTTPGQQTLYLQLKQEYFDAVKAGTKHEEYRLANAFWTKRLKGRTFDRIELALGYPPRGDTTRRIQRPWKGMEVKTITHPHFGDGPVTVYAIRVNG